MLALVAACALLAADAPPPPPADARSDYEAARLAAGRSPDDQVKLALWCEAHGLTAERLKHLAQAVMADPGHAAARGLMGLVSRDGRWQRPEAVAEAIKADPARLALLAEYDGRRSKTPYTADAQLALGLWCEERGLAEQSVAHLTSVTRIDPSREVAWKRLGYKKHDGRWITDTQLAASRVEGEAQKQADRHWKPTLEKWKAMLGQPSRREEAEAAMSAVTDTRAVPSIAKVFATQKEADQRTAVRLLGQIESAAASRGLASLAVSSASADVRRQAIETLRRRDPRDFIGSWIAAMKPPIKYEVKEVGGPGSPGELLIEKPDVNLKRLYTPAQAPAVATGSGSRVEYDANGLPVLIQPIGRQIFNGSRIFYAPIYAYDAGQFNAAITNAAHGGNFQQDLRKQAQAGHPAQRIVGYTAYVLTNDGPVDVTAQVMASNAINGPGRAFVSGAQKEIDLKIPIGQMNLEARQSAAVAKQKLADDIAAIEKVNAEARRSNAPALMGLRTITGKDFGDDPGIWNKWWVDQQGYALNITDSTLKPTVIEDVPLGYTPQVTSQVVGGPTSVTIASHHACFGAGTSVRTIDGVRPIESIRAGDLVLAQDTKAGPLSFRPVLTAFHNPPNATLKVTIGDDAIVVTGIHRFWRVGKGWTMARDLKAGDLVRTIGGVVTVGPVEGDQTQPVFNLEVADGHSFFVGRSGALVHDNSLVEATPEPFDAPAAPKPVAAAR